MKEQRSQNGEKYDMSSFDIRSSSKQHRIPDSLKCAILTLSVEHNKIATAEDLLALLRQISGELCGRLGRNIYELMRQAEACISLQDNSMDAEVLKYAAAYNLIIPNSERDVFKNFIKCH